MAERVLIGKRGTSDYGLYVSQAGINVTTATDAQLMFNSDAVEGFNVLQTGTVSVGARGTSAGINETLSGWVSYNSLGLTYAPLITVGGRYGGALFGLEADTFTSGEGIEEPIRVTFFNIITRWVENDFTNRRFRIGHRNYVINANFGGDVVGGSASASIPYYIYAIGDVTGNASGIYYTSGP
ncbi:MAG: hypothetical protein ACPHIB_02755 [Thalassobaculaceae bacterium]